MIMSFGNVLGDVSFVDTLDGLYLVTYRVTVAAVYSLSVESGGLSAHGSPFKVDIYPDVTSPARTMLTGWTQTLNPEPQTPHPKP